MSHLRSMTADKWLAFLNWPMAAATVSSGPKQPGWSISAQLAELIQTPSGSIRAGVLPDKPHWQTAPWLRSTGALSSYLIGIINPGTEGHKTPLREGHKTGATAFLRVERERIPDGGSITLGNNTFQASYSGGDGNDLTLTVVP